MSKVSSPLEIINDFKKKVYYDNKECNITPNLILKNSWGNLSLTKTTVFNGIPVSVSLTNHKKMFLSVSLPEDVYTFEIQRYKHLYKTSSLNLNKVKVLEEYNMIHTKNKVYPRLGTFPIDESLKLFIDIDCFSSTIIFAIDSTIETSFEEVPIEILDFFQETSIFKKAVRWFK